MDILTIFVIALGLAMNCFALAIANSSVSGKVIPGVPLKTAIAFAMSHFILSFAGYYLGKWAASSVQGIESRAAFLILLVIGLKMIFEAVRRRPETKVFDINSGRVIFALSVAAGMNALLAGLVPGIMAATAITTTITIAITVFFFTLAGLAGGQNFGLPFSKRVAIFGGVFLIFAGLRFLFLNA